MVQLVKIQHTPFFTQTFLLHLLLVKLIMAFNLQSPYSPAGDQPDAIRKLTEGIMEGERYQTLLCVTGSGKT